MNRILCWAAQVSHVDFLHLLFNGSALWSLGLVEQLPSAQGYGTAYYLQTSLILLLFSGAVSREPEPYPLTKSERSYQRTAHHVWKPFGKRQAPLIHLITQVEHWQHLIYVSAQKLPVSLSLQPWNVHLPNHLYQSTTHHPLSSVSVKSWELLWMGLKCAVLMSPQGPGAGEVTATTTYIGI